MFSTLVFAQDAAAKGPSFLEQFMMPLAIFFFIFYFLILRPQTKKAKDQQNFLTALKKGDSVLTQGGILGTIVGVSEKFVDLKVGDGSRLKILKSHISSQFKATQEAVAQK